MTYATASQEGGSARGAGSWLALTAAPTFAIMALIGANDAPPMALCSSGSNILPVDSMTAMYLLMCLFHLPPWLRILSGRPGLARN